MFDDYPNTEREERSLFSRIGHWIIGCGCGCLMVCGFLVAVAVMFWIYSTPRAK